MVVFEGSRRLEPTGDENEMRDEKQKHGTTCVRKMDTSRIRIRAGKGKGGMCLVFRPGKYQNNPRPRSLLCFGFPPQCVRGCETANIRISLFLSFPPKPTVSRHQIAPIVYPNICPGISHCIRIAPCQRTCPTGKSFAFPPIVPGWETSAKIPANVFATQGICRDFRAGRRFGGPAGALFSGPERHGRDTPMAIALSPQ